MIALLPRLATAGINVRALRVPLCVTAAFVWPLPFPVTGTAGFGRVFFRARLLLLGSACALLLLAFLLSPESLGLELVPLAANVFEPVVHMVSVKDII